ncbi:D-sedoheptulose-7-phosphate isomerase [Martelella mediterranea]|uniref:Phosphoheptose isomerase n=1 Tax=Martelella mediterranea TaxID=293089 RepID=A0A4R3NVD2_9HYPH|nr:SIS domain-containing protein [Martelella mediterranea]TCT41995.1 phosphoheptose isomerase [Martelella mediterranea]
MTASLEEEMAAHFAMNAEMRARLPDIIAIADAIWQSVCAGGCVYVFGNGGSAAEALHFSGELIGRYKSNRRPLPATCLSADVSALTCIGNDFSFNAVFARQVTALAGPRDIVIAFSTSGQSENIRSGIAAGWAKGAKTVLFTGQNGAEIAKDCSLAFISPHTMTARIQEMHQLAMHLICARLETLVAESENV